MCDLGCHLRQPAPLICTFIYSDICGCVTGVKSTLRGSRNSPDSTREASQPPRLSCPREQQHAMFLPGLPLDMEGSGTFSSLSAPSQPKGGAMVYPLGNRGGGSVLPPPLSHTHLAPFAFPCSLGTKPLPDPICPRPNKYGVPGSGTPLEEPLGVHRQRSEMPEQKQVAPSQLECPSSWPHFPESPSLKRPYLPGREEMAKRALQAGLNPHNFWRRQRSSGKKEGWESCRDLGPIWVSS